MSVNPAVRDPHAQNIAIEYKDLSNVRAIELCQEKYPKQFRINKIKALVIAIAAIALVIIPAFALLISTVSTMSFGAAALIIAPSLLLGITLLIHKIDLVTLYWTGQVARNVLKIEDEKMRKVKIEENKAPEATITKNV